MKVVKSASVPEMSCLLQQGIPDSSDRISCRSSISSQRDSEALTTSEDAPLVPQRLPYKGCMKGHGHQVSGANPKEQNVTFQDQTTIVDILDQTATKEDIETGRAEKLPPSASGGDTKGNLQLQTNKTVHRKRRAWIIYLLTALILLLLVAVVMMMLIISRSFGVNEEKYPDCIACRLLSGSKDHPLLTEQDMEEMDRRQPRYLQETLCCARDQAHLNTIMEKVSPS